MFPKAWQSVAFVGFILLLIAMVFGNEDASSGIANMAGAGSNNAAGQPVSQPESQAAPAAQTASPDFDERAEDAVSGFADFQIEEYGAPQLDPTPAGTSDWGSPSPSSEPARPRAAASVSARRVSEPGSSQDIPALPRTTPDFDAEINASIKKQAS